MRHNPAELEIALGAALGDEPVLIAELRHAFVESAAGHLDAMAAAIDDVAWCHAARRLQGLAASFGADRLMRAAADAAQCMDRDRIALLRAEIAALA